MTEIGWPLCVHCGRTWYEHELRRQRHQEDWLCTDGYEPVLEDDG